MTPQFFAESIRRLGPGIPLGIHGSYVGLLHAAMALDLLRGTVEQRDGVVYFTAKAGA